MVFDSFDLTTDIWSFKVKFSSIFTPKRGSGNQHYTQCIEREITEETNGKYNIVPYLLSNKCLDLCIISTLFDNLDLTIAM